MVDRKERFGMKRAVREVKNKFDNVGERESAAKFIAEADYSMKGGSLGDAEKYLNSAYDHISDSSMPEETKDKYLKSIQTRTYRLVRRLGKPDDGNIYLPSGQIFLKDYTPREYTEAYTDELLHKTRELSRKVDIARSRLRGLESRTTTAAIMGILGLALGIFFLSSNLTGNVVGNLTNSTSNIIGAVLLVIGLIAGYFYFKKKSSKNKSKVKITKKVRKKKR